MRTESCSEAISQQQSPLRLHCGDPPLACSQYALHTRMYVGERPWDLLQVPAYADVRCFGLGLKSSQDKSQPDLRLIFIVIVRRPETNETVDAP
jgi:hypothetical protein